MDFNYHISIMAINAATYQITITTYNAYQEQRMPP